ncbi:hypothetical protein J0H33_17250, partial [bacterium]|nr:hypothetical protein [bacterium]
MDAISYNYDYEAQAEGLLAGRARARGRSAVLRRFLLGSDLIAGLVSGALTTLIFGLSAPQGAAVTATLMAFAILLSFFFGLYGDNDLQTWASGLADTPRMVVAMLLSPALV